MRKLYYHRVGKIELFLGFLNSKSIELTLMNNEEESEIVVKLTAVISGVNQLVLKPNGLYNITNLS